MAKQKSSTSTTQSGKRRIFNPKSFCQTCDKYFANSFSLQRHLKLIPHPEPGAVDVNPAEVIRRQLFPVEEVYMVVEEQEQPGVRLIKLSSVSLALAE